MSTTETKPTSTGIIGPVRFSYLTVFKPRQNPNKDGIVMEYSVTMLIPKEPNSFCPEPKAIGKQVSEMVKAALLEFFKEAPPKWTNPLQDGDTELDSAGKPKHPGYWFFRAWAKDEYPPLLIDCNQDKVTSGWQSGDWGKAKVSFYGYDRSGNKGVSCGLRGIQFLKHDEPFGSGGTSPDEFEKVAGDGPLNATAEEYDPFQD